MISEYKENIITNIKRRYIFALGLLTFFVLFSYAYFLSSKKFLANDGYIINASGRQRFLSQQISLFALQFADSKNHWEKNRLQEELIRRINEMETGHNLLVHDSVSVSSHYHSPAVDSVYFKPPELLDKKIDAYLDHAAALGEMVNTDTITTQNSHLKYLLASSNNLLNGLDRIVNLYQKEYEDEVSSNAHRISLMTIGSLVAFFLIGALIFRPMTNKTNKTLTDLSDKEEEVQRINENHVVAIIEAQESERQRIASDLHDGLIQTLTTMAYKFDVAVAGHTREQDPGFFESKELVQNAINETRNIAYSILPPLLKEFGLIPALNSLCEQERLRGNIKINFQTFDFSERLENRLELTLYRIVQEALNNIIKYAEAKNVSLQIVRHPDSLILTIEDDGNGFDTTKKIEPKGIGIMNMEERIKVFHGNFSITSTADMGTGIMAEVPLNNHLAHNE